MSWSGTINARKCAAYLRSIGIVVPEAAADEWERVETEDRTRRRAHKAELKRSCGHFRTYVARVTSEHGTTSPLMCHDCGRMVRAGPSIVPVQRR